MLLDKIMQVMRENSDKTAFITDGSEYTYWDLLEACDKWEKQILDIPEGSIVCVRGEFDINSIALMFALINRRCIYVPLARTVRNIEFYLDTAESEYFFDMDKEELQKREVSVSHPILLGLRERRTPGLVFFSSGTTGVPKAAVHDMTPYIHRFEKKGKPFRQVAFLLFDHLGGFNTIMHAVSSGGLLVTLSDRSPDEVCNAIEQYQLDLLPTSPTFLHMILLGRYYEKYDLSSLKMISYGTEPMPESTLVRFHQLFPNVKLKQTYGLTEVGVFRTKSKASDSLWMKVGGDSHHQVKVVDGILYIKSDMAMLGYLNAEAPFDEEGWYNTGDKVEVDGEYMLIKGRDSDLINVGGEKVYPAEVESVLLEISGVADAAVVGIPNPVMGQVVQANIFPEGDVDRKELTKRIKSECRERLEKYKRPVKIKFSEQPFQSARFKKKR